MQQDAEDDGQDTDNEFPESDEMNQTGFSGEKKITKINQHLPKQCGRGVRTLDLTLGGHRF